MSDFNRGIKNKAFLEGLHKLAAQESGGATFCWIGR
jgi:hypothetical protein